jgi:hypothetical protein
MRMEERRPCPFHQLQRSQKKNEHEKQEDDEIDRVFEHQLLHAPAVSQSFVSFEEILEAKDLDPLNLFIKGQLALMGSQNGDLPTGPSQKLGCNKYMLAEDVSLVLDKGLSDYQQLLFIRFQWQGLSLLLFRSGLISGWRFVHP